MINYLMSLWESFVKKTIIKKILLIFLLIIYIFIIVICTVHISVDKTTPGYVNDVSYLIDVESENPRGKVYTVSVFSSQKVSILEYFLSSMDNKSSIIKGKRQTIYTKKEENKIDTLFKEQSIQDSIILAYETAKSNHYDVSLSYEYIGYCLLYIPQNYLNTDLDDFRIGDIIIAIDGVDVDENIDVANIITSLSIPEKKKFKVLRDNVEMEITPSDKMIDYLTTQKLNKSLGYKSYKIDYDNAKPKLDREKSNTVGPSGGLMQTISVYNAIIPEDITHGKRIMGTGTISLDGSVGKIGGIEQKVATVDLYDGDIFFLPESNYEEAKKMYDKIKKPSFDLVVVNDFTEAIQYLERLGENNG